MLKKHSIGHPYRPGTPVKVCIHHFLADEAIAFGHDTPEAVYWNPKYAAMNLGRIISNGLSESEDVWVPGFVLKSLEADELIEIPEEFRGQERYTVYLVLIGEGPPIWFPWREIFIRTIDDDSTKVFIIRNGLQDEEDNE